VVSAAAAAAVAASAVAVAASRGAFWLVYDSQAKVALAQWDLDREEYRGTSAVRGTQAECPPWARRDSDSDGLRLRVGLRCPPGPYFTPYTNAPVVTHYPR
jgi:hypothetical protein